jgi:glycosyltransferase involved in cell wall biosynthesis
VAKKKHSSIVMATYNGEKYLSEQLDSFCKQSVLPDELVVSDDNSKDATKEIILNFAKTAPFKVLFVENNHNSGVVKNFENALKHAKGDIIFFSDQDDYWLSNKIEKYMSVFEENK